MGNRVAAALAPFVLAGIFIVDVGQGFSADHPNDRLAIFKPIGERSRTNHATGVTALPSTYSQDPLSTLKLNTSESRLDKNSGGINNAFVQGAFVLVASAEECREFESTSTVAGETKSYRGIACRQPDGQWKMKSMQEHVSPPSGQMKEIPPGSYNCSMPDGLIRRDLSRNQCVALGGYSWQSGPGVTGYRSPTALFGLQGRGDAAASGDDLFQSPVAPGEQRIVHSGYSRYFRPVRVLITEGRFGEALSLYDSLTTKIKTIRECDAEFETCQPTDSSLPLDSTTPGVFLSALERGALAIDTGKLSEGIENLNLAEAEITERKKAASPLAFLKQGAIFLAETLLGVEELEDYNGEGFERVLMLNYKTIAYLLSGKREAYNVTRRAIDWQNLEKKRFEERLRKAQEELKSFEKEQQQQGRDVAGLGVTQVLSERYALNASRANAVPSAYVNPFGYYVQGMVQEFDSYADTSLRDNARISYEKALELNPSSETLKLAIEELKKRAPPQDTKLIQVVVAEGLSPLKKTMVFGMQVGNMIFPVKVPIYVPVPSPIQSLEVQSLDGASLGMLSPLADIEAIALRHEKDSEPFQNLRVSLAVVRTVFEKHLFQQLGGIGNLISRARDAMTTPDMRSWLSLPARIHVGRFHVPKTLGAIRLVVQDKSGHLLTSKEVELGPSHSFVYGRCIGNNLIAYANKKLWVDDL